MRDSSASRRRACSNLAVLSFTESGTKRCVVDCALVRINRPNLLLVCRSPRELGYALVKGPPHGDLTTGWVTQTVGDAMGCRATVGQLFFSGLRRGSHIVATWVGSLLGPNVDDLQK